RPESRAHGEAALALAETRHDVYNLVRARGALGLEALTRGGAAEAVEWLAPAATRAADGGVGNPNFFRFDADLVEALARSGRAAETVPHLDRLERQGRATGGAWSLAAAARCRAFLAADDEFVDRFDAALRLHER